MDLNDLRSVVTVLSLLAFLAIVFWAYSRGNRARFDEAARLPFENDNIPGSGGSKHE
ncbi:MAG: cbb3-type cytochrome c oxidase subunit 3 [Burkholderiales bacterium]|nr:cbb3-type cytochrome c oxidase subunit 3 [Burkholderiales bacterium]